MEFAGEVPQRQRPREVSLHVFNQPAGHWVRIPSGWFDRRRTTTAAAARADPTGQLLFENPAQRLVLSLFALPPRQRGRVVNDQAKECRGARESRALSLAQAAPSGRSRASGRLEYGHAHADPVSRNREPGVTNAARAGEDMPTGRPLRCPFEMPRETAMKFRPMARSRMVATARRRRPQTGGADRGFASGGRQPDDVEMETRQSGEQPGQGSFEPGRRDPTAFVAHQDVCGVVLRRRDSRCGLSGRWPRWRNPRISPPLYPLGNLPHQIEAHQVPGGVAAVEAAPGEDGHGPALAAQHLGLREWLEAGW